MGSDRLGSDPFRTGSAMVRIHSVCMGQVRNWNSTVPYEITLISGFIWYRIADPIRTGSTRSHVNTELIRTKFALVTN